MQPLDEKTAVALRTLIITAIGSSLTVWDVAFWLGVHGTIFYNKLFVLWIASTVVLLVAVVVPKADRFISWWDALALLAPTIWFVINALTPVVTTTWLEEIVWLVALAIFAFNIPYIIYILFRLVETDAWDLSPMYRNRLVAILVIIALIGFFVGFNHENFVTCEDFQIAGDSPPADCFSPASETGDG